MIFCNAHGIMIRTHDMNADYRERSKSFTKERYLNGTLPMDVFKLPFKLRDEKIKMDLIYRTLDWMTMSLMEKDIPGRMIITKRKQIVPGIR